MRIAPCLVAKRNMHTLLVLMHSTSPLPSTEEIVHRGRPNGQNGIDTLQDHLSSKDRGWNIRNDTEEASHTKMEGVSKEL